MNSRSCYLCASAVIRQVAINFICSNKKKQWHSKYAKLLNLLSIIGAESSCVANQSKSTGFGGFLWELIVVKVLV